MKESEIRVIDALKDLPILDEDDPTAQPIVENRVASVAEVGDAVRLHELLHRNEYRPLAGIRYRRGEQENICIYFRRLDDT
jgi:hypothetical protein